MNLGLALSTDTYSKFFLECWQSFSSLDTLKHLHGTVTKQTDKLHQQKLFDKLVQLLEEAEKLVPPGEESLPGDGTNHLELSKQFAQLYKLCFKHK